MDLRKKSRIKYTTPRPALPLLSLCICAYEVLGGSYEVLGGSLLVMEPWDEQLDTKTPGGAMKSARGLCAILYYR